jgi:hypothetical protein
MSVTPPARVAQRRARCTRTCMKSVVEFVFQRSKFIQHSFTVSFIHIVQLLRRHRNVCAFTCVRSTVAQSAHWTVISRWVGPCARCASAGRASGRHVQPLCSVLLNSILHALLRMKITHRHFISSYQLKKSKLYRTNCPRDRAASVTHTGWSLTHPLTH